MKLKQIFKNYKIFQKLIINSTYVTSAILSSGFLGYLFHIILARLLSSSSYSIIISLLTLVTIITAPSAAIVMIVCKEVSSILATEKNYNKTKLIFIRIYKLFFLFFLVLLIIFILIHDYFLIKFNIDKSAYLLFLLFIFFNFLGFINIGFLQALENFKSYSISFVLGNLSKIIICYILIRLGLDVNGALLGILAAALVIFIYTFITISKKINLFSGQKEFLNKNFSFINFKIAFTILIANVSFIIITQIDILLVKFFFSTKYLETYVPVSTLAKVILYVPSAFSITLFPLLIKSFVKKNNTLKFMIFGLICCLLSGIIISCLFFIFSNEIINILIGSEYNDSAKLLKYAGFCFIPFSIIYFLEHYLIARNTIVFAYLLFIFVPIQMYLYHFFNDYYYAPILVNLSIGVLILKIFFIMYKFKIVKI